jgi:hypothetical protein
MLRALGGTISAGKMAKKKPADESGLKTIFLEGE